MGRPRDYQKAAVDAIFRFFHRNKDGHPLIVAPTGSGKTHILGYFCQRVLEKYPYERILIITHTKEIIQQDARIMREYVDPQLVGIYSSGLKLKQLRKYNIASIQSIYRKAELFKDYKLIIVDEAHLIPPSGEGRYRTFFKNCPERRILGLTATPFRRGHGTLLEGHIFTEIIYDIPIQRLIDEGHLCDISSKAPEYTMNTKGIKVIAGDYSKAALSRQLDNTTVTNHIINELIKYKDQFKSWLIFAIDIAHCKHISDKLSSLGIKVAPVHSQLDFDRSHLLELFKENYIQALVSVETLTTGFDAPNVDLIVLMRPTTSPVLHVQMIGRGMRPYPNKPKCTVLDFAGNLQRLGPIDNVILTKSKRGKGKGKAPVKVCPECKEIIPAITKECKVCGHVFKIKTKLKTNVENNAVVLTKYQKPKKFKVTQLYFAKHKKPGKLPSLKVTYACGFNFYKEWIAFEHKGYPRVKASQWWKALARTPTPDTVDEALARRQEIQKPSHIYVNLNGKYPEIIRHEFASDA